MGTFTLIILMWLDVDLYSYRIEVARLDHCSYHIDVVGWDLYSYHIDVIRWGPLLLSY